MLISLIFVHPVFAVEESEFDYFSSHYFYKLGYNIPSNEEESYGYVALSIFLSYYDSYWHDSFVDEKFGENLYYDPVFPNSNSNDTITIRVMQSDGIIVTDIDVVEKNI